jgi:Icc-related predicted phosphoesterase
MRVLHTSDLHGRYKDLLNCDEDFDVWVDTGDFFPTAGRDKGLGGRIHYHTERAYQLRWCSYKQIGGRLFDWLMDRPLITVPGNHDFIPLHGLIKQAGGESYQISTLSQKILGHTWAGFREINYIDGEWEGETHDFVDIVDDVMRSDPDILVTHAPPAGILDSEGGEGYGITRLASALTHQKHSIKHHFFGHVHKPGGLKTYLMDTWFYNGAENVKVHVIDL